MRDIGNTIATTLQGFELVVQAFDKTTTEALHEVVGDLLEPVGQGGEELVETGQARTAHFRLPLGEARERLGFGQG